MTYPGDFEEDLIRATNAEQALKLAEKLMPKILELARMMTPKGWELAVAQALYDQKWHTSDVALIKDVRLISMRGGTRYRPEYNPTENKGIMNIPPERQRGWHGEGSCYYCGKQWLHEWSICAKTAFSEDCDAILDREYKIGQPVSEAADIIRDTGA